MEREVKFKKEKEASSESEPLKIYLKNFDYFLSLSDEPGRHITDEEKENVTKSRDVEALNKLVAEKTGSKYGGVEYTPSKYRKNAFNFLTAAGLLFEQPEFLKKINDKEKDRLYSEVQNLAERIRYLRGNDALITKAEIDRGVALINELKQIIAR